MKDNLKDILAHLNKDVDQETLLLYLQGKLSNEQQHEVEKHLLDNEFASEAVEGLGQVSSGNEVSKVVEELNKNLRIKTIRKKKPRRIAELKEDKWLWISVLILLMLVLICYIIIHIQLRKG
jgi:hypothetical protein